MATVGRIKVEPGENGRILIVPGCGGNNEGFYFMDINAFNGKDGSICYVPEYAFDDKESVLEDEDGDWYDAKDIDVYTFNDFVRIAGTEDRARALFEGLDWQYPETLMEEYNQGGVWDEDVCPSQKEGICPICGKPFEYGSLEVEGNQAYYEWTCPHCGSQGKEWYKLEFAENAVSFVGDTEQDGEPVKEDKNE
jgi:DNA-directed RNA polymerase subunit RPC12/RpoP